MPKLKEGAKNVEPEKEDESEAEGAAPKAKEEAIEAVKEKAKEVKAASGGKPVNVIGEIEKPDDDAPASEWKEWGKSVEAKLDAILAKLSDDEEPADLDAEEDEEEVSPWWDRKVF